MNRLRALIVDDHALIAQGVALALEGESVDTRVTMGPRHDDVLRAAEEHRPDVVLLDLQLEGEIGSAVPLIAPLAELGAKVLVVTGVTDRPDLAECIEAGADGIASKSEPFESLVATLLKIGRGEAVMSKHEQYALLDELHEHRRDERRRFEPFERLTPRERQVLSRLVAGLQAEAIAHESYVSIATIRSQIRSILQKLGVSSQLQAVAVARDAGWADTSASVSG